MLARFGPPALVAALLWWALPGFAQPPLFRTLIDESQFGTAETHARDRLARLERLGRTATVEAADTLNDLAEALLRQINNLAARPIVERAIRIEQARGADAEVPLIRSLALFAEISDLAIDFKTLQVMVDTAWPLAERLLRPEDRLRIDVRHWKAVSSFRAGDTAVGERGLLAVLADGEGLFGPDSFDAARSRHSLALFYSAMRRYDEARGMAQRALEIREKRRDYFGAGNEAHIIGAVLAETGEFAAAKAALELSVDYRLRSVGKNHPLTARTIEMLRRLP